MKNRIIKFRAWNDEDKVMIEADHLAFEEYAPLVDQLKSCKHLMQFTGLHDKNGVEIYEGDILQDGSTSEYENGDCDRCEVRYDEKLARFVLHFFSIYGGEGYTGRDQHIDDYAKTNEVIGNIYQTAHSEIGKDGER